MSRPFTRFELWDFMTGQRSLDSLLTAARRDAVVAVDEVDCAGAAALAARLLRSGRRVWPAAARAFSGSALAQVEFLRNLSGAGGCMFPPGIPDAVMMLGFKRPGMAPQVESVQFLSSQIES